jgi:hypothetical protein
MGTAFRECNVLLPALPVVIGPVSSSTRRWFITSWRVMSRREAHISPRLRRSLANSSSRRRRLLGSLRAPKTVSIVAARYVNVYSHIENN